MWVRIHGELVNRTRYDGLPPTLTDVGWHEGAIDDTASSTDSMNRLIGKTYTLRRRHMDRVVGFAR